ncbi:hypothetical protein A7U60_g4244 [Sanghuangporus baumii]|uniref:Uncharacterized protein n=1 Tax=Sanghuangporus baumii TaxID=108892 RepID=A0A9Q5HZ46_SANBA|nr:hypothetical protein A7U60_g4244 [Sanghuangporus baumii]
MDALLTGVRDALTARYLIVATVAFQIRFIWTSKIGVRHLHFFLNRYAPFATSFLGLYYVVLKGDLKARLQVWFRISFTTIIGMLIAELTVFLRVDAVWGHKLFIRILLGLSFLCSCTVILYFASIHIEKNHVLQLHYMSGCLYVHDDRMIWIALLAYTLCELVAIVLLLTKAFLGFRLDNSPVMKNLYQDGIMYFSIITISTIANLVLLLTASSTLSDAFLIPESVLVNVLCSHMHLRIRKSNLESLHTTNDALGIELRAPVFASFEGSQTEDLTISRYAF